MKLKTKPINVRVDRQLLSDFMQTEVYRLNRNNLTAAVEDVMRSAVAAEQKVKKAEAEMAKKEGNGK